MPRDRLTLSAALVVAALLGPLVLPPAPVAAAPPANRQCKEPGTAMRELPWHQRAYDPQRIAPITSGEGVTVAVIDSGVDATHPQLRGRVLPGGDFLYPGGGPGNWDCVGHGTAVASIIVGGGERDIAFRGYAPRATVLPLVVSEQNAQNGEGAPGSAAGFAAAIRAAVAAKAGVINISLVLYQDDAGVRDAVKEAVASDIVVVAAVGNANQDPALAKRPPYPAAYPGVIGVGAVSSVGQRTDSSPAGPWVDLMAPGSEIVAAGRGSGYGVHNGTSFAAPFVSAAAALMRAREPGLSAAAVAARLFASADPGLGSRTGVEGSTEYGKGIVNPYRAVAEYVLPSATGTAAALPGYTGAPVDPVRRWQQQVAVIVGFVVLGGAALVAAAAAAMPRGRRRRWLPGRAAPPRPLVVADGNRRLFDDLEE